ncbi:MAG TPA: TetR/AcrR family transcriptional regulator [Thermoanaerobaculia bacterium]|jgi:AcrR family transcriptional regulator|nr:TetR/AcrR family transcriptional regulator [Thermoanaerobaculia bacterium]
METAEAHAEGPTRERLIEVAERLFSEGGFTATSVRHITAEAGCNLASVNYHFGGKDQLYEEVFRRRLEMTREQRVASIRSTVDEAGGSPSLETLLRAFSTAFLEPFMTTSAGRQWHRLMRRELHEPHLPQGMFVGGVITPVYEELAGALVRLQPGLDLETARCCTYSVVGQLVQLLRVERYSEEPTFERASRMSLPELIEHVVVFSVAGIHAAAGDGKAPAR